jgi:hypothetical protein
MSLEPHLRITVRTFYNNKEITALEVQLNTEIQSKLPNTYEVLEAYKKALSEAMLNDFHYFLDISETGIKLNIR